jgi:hypothetical protein
MKKKIFVLFFVGIFITLSAGNITLGSSIMDSNQCVVMNNPPSKPIVEGPSEVKRYEGFNLTVQSTDPEGDDLYYISNYIPDYKSRPYKRVHGPYPSGQTQTIGPFGFGYKGFSYEDHITIQAMDVHEAYSEPTIFKVSITKSYSQFNIFPQFVDLLELIKEFKINKNILIR